MRRFFLFLALTLTALLIFGACGITEEGALDVSDGGAAKGCGGGVGGGTCFPGAKVCPQGGKLVCLNSNTPDIGCKASTACDPCKVPHATAKCSDAGSCAIDKCDAGWDDCNNNPADGCETNLNTTDTHCGSCGNDCIVSKGANWICNGSGQCEVNQCCPNGPCPLRDCDGNKTNGCEVDISQDVNNCTACGTACSLQNATPACQSGCVIQSCNPGYQDCNTQSIDGCEIHTDADSAHCGNCTKVCNSTNGGAACVGGACQISCNTGFADCDNNVDTGCEINVASDTVNCGGCGNNCDALPNTTGNSCSNGGCVIGCVGGHANCDGTVGNGCEIDTTSDQNHCGSCPKVCSAPGNASAYCSGSNCGFNCNGGYHLCGASCFSDGDATHCGGGCQNCPGPTGGSGSPTCSGGACGLSCSGGTPNLCGTVCVNFGSDSSHCGNCTTVCSPPPNGSNNCSGGSCQPSCNPGYHYCNGSCWPDSDTGHCGATCKTCSGPTSGSGSAACSGGNCTINCTGGTPDLCGTACVDKNGDPMNCGSCGHICGNGNTGCSAGVCQCASGFSYCTDTLGCKDCCTVGTGTGCQNPKCCQSDYTCSGSGC